MLHQGWISNNVVIMSIVYYYFYSLEVYVFFLLQFCSTCSTVVILSPLAVPYSNCISLKHHSNSPWLPSLSFSARVIHVTSYAYNYMCRSSNIDHCFMIPLLGCLELQLTFFIATLMLLLRGSTAMIHSCQYHYNQKKK